jgi:lipopolysaccharide transport system permease protein
VIVERRMLYALPVHIRIRPTRGWTALDPRALWDNRELLYFLIWRDLKVRYAQTALGTAWAVLPPLSMMLLFTVLSRPRGYGERHPIRCSHGAAPVDVLFSATTTAAYNLSATRTS